MSIGDPRRNPIGFAPPAEQDAEPRYRTEITFRRHHELPRASATPVFPEDGVQPAWQSPMPLGSARGDEPDPVAEASDVDQNVPFYKREIGFRRKKTTIGEPAAAEAVVGTTADEPESAAHVEGPAAEATDEWEAPVAETEVVAVSAELDEHEIVEAAEPDDLAAAAPTVPFYKREISFRRKKAVAEVAAAALVTDAVSDADEASQVVDGQPEIAGDGFQPDADATTPFEAHADGPVQADVVAEQPALAADHEGSEPLGDDSQVDDTSPVHDAAAVSERHQLDADAALEDQLGHDVDDGATEQPAAAGVAIGFASAAATSDDAWHTEATPPESETAEAIAPTDEIEVTDETALLPAAVAAEAVTDADTVPDLPGVTGDDTPASADRFGSRKRKSAKNPKRQGGKGRKVVGLKIGASQLAAAVISETERGRELLGLARRPLASGIVVDGEVRDEAALANAVKLFFDEEKLPKTDVRIGLSSNRIGVRTLDIDGVEDESRFDNAVRFKAHEVLPVALSESVLDYRVLEERVAEDGARSRRVLLVVAPRDQVEPYSRMSNLAGIRLEAIDLEALALLRAFVEPSTGAPAPDDTASVVVSIGHESSTLLVAGGGACEFTRVFDWGGGVLEEAIAASLEVRSAEAATILRHLSLSGPGRQYENLDEITRAKATDAVRQRLTPFARELVNSLQFYQTQAGSLGIGGIQITGGTSQLEGIEDALHQMIGVNVSVGDPLSRVIRAADFDPTLESMIGSLAVPIGLAIDDVSMRGVNLLPKGSVAKTSTRSKLTSIGAPVAVAVPLVALGFLYFGAHNRVADQQSQIDAARDELASLPQPTAPVIDSAVVGDEAARATAVANVLGGRLAWEAVFRDMSRVLPENVWLSTMSLTAPEGANLADGTIAAVPAAAGVEPVPTAVSIEGYTYTQPDVARLLARLATLPSLKRVTLTSSQSAEVSSKKVVHFVIVADLNQTGGAS